MIIIVVLIGAFVMNYVLVKIYGHLWEKDLDARVEFQKEPSCGRAGCHADGDDL